MALWTDNSVLTNELLLFIVWFKLLFDHYVHCVFVNCLAEKMPFSFSKKPN